MSTQHFTTLYFINEIAEKSWRPISFTTSLPRLDQFTARWADYFPTPVPALTVMSIVEGCLLCEPHFVRNSLMSTLPSPNKDEPCHDKTNKICVRNAKTQIRLGPRL